MTVRRTRRSRGADGPARPIPNDPAAIADEVTRLAVALPLDYGDTLASITRLLVIDPLNQSHMDAIVEAVIRSALMDPFYETTANRWRALVPPWVRTQSMSGATVNMLLRIGILVTTGRYARCDNTASRNANKWQPIYALDLVALRDLLRPDAAASAGTA
ncbi:hypothetical protein JOF56_005741 [Kibdelosporangium banguiense]|uniref:Uncharacterized protein n=1 Tax=Kibdelosporangium banguiense TaxID=1365924 RepID=A0ABS4TLU4_9PSEU|nr:hypothetical protein [Kibdelosporangium banguiense]MBP2325356.1 hypothetical protein [Kibdelosporangium banguiense]